MRGWLGGGVAGRFLSPPPVEPRYCTRVRLALEMGYEQVEMAQIASFAAAFGADDAWRHNDPLPIPPMTPKEALQLLYLYQKEVRLQAEPAHLKRRKGE